MLAIWLRSDLRLIDNPAVNQAVEEARIEEKELIFIHDRLSTLGSIGIHTRRKNYEANILMNLKVQINESGYKLYHADKDNNIVKICNKLGVAKIHSLQEWGDAESYENERNIKKQLRSLNIEIKDHAHSGILRGKEYQDYRNQSDPDTRAQMKPYWIGKPEMQFIIKPDSLIQLDYYLDTRLYEVNYAKNNWRADIGADISSKLSFALACGDIAPERIIYEIQNREKSYKNTGKKPPYSLQKFKARLDWREDFIQSYETNHAAYPDLRKRHIWLAEHEEYEREISDYNHMPWSAISYDERLQRWVNGETNIPFIDASMKALHEAGWITFRQRQTIVSFAIDLLDLDWRDVLVETAKLFGDYTPGIHNPQLSLQAGVAAPERGPRIVNPLKQAYALDPHANYVRKWLPKLSNLQDAVVHTPWKAINVKPIVDIENAMKMARKIWPIKHGLEQPKQTQQGSLF